MEWGDLRKYLSTGYKCRRLCPSERFKSERYDSLVDRGNLDEAEITQTYLSSVRKNFRGKSLILNG